MRPLQLLILLSLVACGGAASSNNTIPEDSSSSDPTAAGYEIVLSRDGVLGERTRMSVQDNQQSVVVNTIDGKTEREETKSRLSVVATHTVKKVNEDGRVIHSELVIDKLTLDGGDGAKRLLEGGVVVHVHRAFAQENGRITADGLTLDEETTEALDKLFTLELSQSRDDDMFGPGKRMPVGGKWTMNPAKVRASAEKDGIPFTLRDIEGGMSIIGQTDVAGEHCLEIEGGFSAGLAAPQGRSTKSDALTGQMDVKVWGLFPTNVTLPRLESRMVMNITVTAKGEEDGKAVVSKRTVERTKTTEIEIL